MEQKKKGVLMLSHRFTKLKMQRYFENEPRFKGVYCQSSLKPIAKDWTYVVYLDEYKSIGTHWTALYASRNILTYFDNFGAEHTPQKIMRFIGNNKIITNIFRIQANDSIMCVYFCILCLEVKS